MGYSGLIYAAIVAGWAAVLVPRWIRRNDEIERAQEADEARGVRVLERRNGHIRGGHVSAFARTLGQSTVARPESPRSSEHTTTMAEPAAHQPNAAARAVFTDAARRRRRVLGVLTLALVGVGLGVAAGALPSAVIAVPATMLTGFLVLARRAAVTESRRHALARTAARRLEVEAASQGQPAKRVAVFDPPEPAPAPDPNAWQPVPVPLPTYLTKAKASPAAIRKIDLSAPGAWTSGRLDPASSVALSPPGRQSQAGDEAPAESADFTDYPERRRAVGD